jgi:hypothetical protein
MNNKFTVVVLLIGLIVCQGQLYTKTSALTDFSTVIVSGPIEATLLKSTKGQITVQASSQDLLGMIVFTKKGNVLTVKLNGTVNIDSNTDVIRVKISYVKLTGVQARNTAVLTTDSISKVSKFTAVADNVANITIATIQADLLYLIATDVSNIIVQGNATRTSIDTNQMGTVSADQLTAQTAEISAQQMSNVQVIVIKTATATATDMSQITITGGGIVRKYADFMSTINSDDDDSDDDDDGN